MTWHVICLDEETDTYTINNSDFHYILPVPLHHPTHPNAISTNFRDTLSEFNLFPSDEAIDFLHAAISVYTADVRVKRAVAFDNWTRDFVLHLPVFNPKLWEDTVPVFEQMLTFLTGDHWEIKIRKSKRSKRNAASNLFKPVANRVSLFSGGLDSFVGAIDLLEDKKPLFLVSHYVSGPLSEVQKQVYALLDKQYPGVAKHLRFYVQPPKSSTKQTELTTRSRSILFMALAVSVASACNQESAFYVPENGLISLNVPLTHTRTSSLSTRTTHPYFMNLIQTILNSLGLNISVKTPYQFKTKGEMLRNARNQALLKKGAPLTMSCSHPGVGRHTKGGNPYQHCGYCVPCIIRRASMASVGLDKSESYGIDIINQPPHAEKGTGRDFRAFQMALERSTKPDYIPMLEVLNSGPLPSGSKNITDYVHVFQRGMEEVHRFIDNGVRKA